MPLSPEHPSGWTLEVYAEEALPGEEGARVAAHVSECAHCSAVVDSLRSLYAEMSNLPRFSPSTGFADGVMARVRLAPQPSPIYAWLLRWLPATRRGWAMLLGLAIAPALPIIALIGWLLSNPLVTPAGLWAVGTQWTSNVAWSALVAVAGGIVESRAAQAANGLLQDVLAAPAEVLLGAGLILAVGIPLSVWILYRTLRTPTRGSMYAH